MRKSVARVKGLGFVLWHSRHEFYHVLIGLVWSWVLREIWNQFNTRWVILAVMGSLLPDVDHLFYFFSYGRKDPYSTQILRFLKERKWRALTVFVENGHKRNTNLSYHNYYFMTILFGLAAGSTLVDWNVGVILFGAMLLHYLFDIGDDLVTLGQVNPNWKRWGKPRVEP